MRKQDSNGVEIDKTLADAAVLVSRETASKTLTKEQVDLFNQEYFVSPEVLIVQALEEEQITATGIVKPNAKRGQRALVVLAGELSGNQPGQIVLVTKNGGTDIELEGVELLKLDYKQRYVTKRKGLFE